MKIFIFTLLVGFAIIFLGCDQELKEHPMPTSLKRRLEMQNDPEIQRKKVTGTITIANSAKVRQVDPVMLFIFARPKGQESGPPLAVKRLSGVSFPFLYSIGQMDTMLEGADFSGEVQITARLDSDGVAGAGLGDLEGKALAMVGSENTDIILDLSQPGKTNSSGAISGTLDLTKALKNNLPKHPYLFIYVRSEGALTGSPPLAVKRLKKISFPYKFSISEQDSMIPGAKFEGRVILTARLDGDGDAKPMPGDIKGEILIETGAHGVFLVLDKLVRPSSDEDKNKGDTVSGVISVSSEIEKEIVGETKRMFIILRKKGSAGRIPPMAVQLHGDIQFPFNYEIGQRDAMMPRTLVTGEVEVVVRIDRDGNAKSSLGDLEGGTFATVGDRDINIVLNKKV